MTLVPKTVSRFNHRSLLKLKGASPTILVVAGVGGLVATAVMAARATRDIDPVMDQHKQTRSEIGYVGKNRVQQQDLVRLYRRTGWELTKIYGPTIFVGTCSAVSVLAGHKILRGRHIATMAAYSGLFEQFQSYRSRVADTLGKDVEKGIYDGARGEWQEDPDHKGEYKLKPVFDKDKETSYLRPWFDEVNYNWTKDAEYNYMFLKSVQTHMNQILMVRGHLFLNEVLDALKMPRRPEGAVTGWLYEKNTGDDYVDFGFMSSLDPNTVAFCNGAEPRVQLNFNVDGPIWDKI